MCVGVQRHWIRISVQRHWIRIMAFATRCSDPLRFVEPSAQMFLFFVLMRKLCVEPRMAIVLPKPLHCRILEKTCCCLRDVAAGTCAVVAALEGAASRGRDRCRFPKTGRAASMGHMGMQRNGALPFLFYA